MFLVINIIKENIFWLKDIFTILFTGIITIIAILTYRRAKETLLQPIRSEVIKRQADILIDLLPIIESSQFDRSVNYKDLVILNMTYWLPKYGFIFASEEKKEYVKENSAMVIFLPDKDGKIDVIKIDAFKENSGKNKSKISFEEGKRLYEKAKKGNININSVHLTRDYVLIGNKIRRFIDNPFVPNTISEGLEELLREMRRNSVNHMIDTIDWIIRELIKRGNKGVLISDGVFNEFNSRRIHHRETLNKIRSRVRKYLKIESTYWN